MDDKHPGESIRFEIEYWIVSHKLYFYVIRHTIDQPLPLNDPAELVTTSSPLLQTPSTLLKSRTMPIGTTQQVGVGKT